MLGRVCQNLNNASGDIKDPPLPYLCYSFSRSATNSATSFTCISPPCDLEASVSIAMQKGQPTARVPAPVALACAKRSALTRVVPASSSFHACAPPAPQQKDLAELRGISIVSAPVL